VNSPVFSSADITDAQFAFLGEQYVWIGLTVDDPASPSTILLASADQGQTWSFEKVSDYSILSMQFIDRDHGWAIGIAHSQSAENAYGILSTKDGGKHWLSGLETVRTARLSSCHIQFLNAQDGFARFDDTLLSTGDGGESWSQVCSIENLMSVDFKNDKEGWATSADAIFHTTDGGNTWSQEWSLPENMTRRLEPVSSKVIMGTDSEGWALFSGQGTMAQSAKMILHREPSGNWIIMSGYYLAEPPFSGNAAPSFSGDLFPASTASAFLVGYPPRDYPAVLQTNDQGRTWSEIMQGGSRPNGFPVMSAGDFVRVEFVNEQRGWGIVVNKSAADRGLNIVRSEDGGASWTVVMEES
jgi:photosystem II stability/assembly factor-like uncharacterized protein